jgi:large subunit ribosomal protein L15
MKYVGKKGFVSVTQKRNPSRTLNLMQLSAMLDRLIEEKKVQFENQIPVIDLEALGFSKLLGNGVLVRPIRVKVAKCSESAQRKIKDAGGEAILSKAT